MNDHSSSDICRIRVANSYGTVYKSLDLFLLYTEDTAWSYAQGQLYDM
jgi:hypothetical protein